MKTLYITKDEKKESQESALSLIGGIVNVLSLQHNQQKRRIWYIEVFKINLYQYYFLISEYCNAINQST